MKKILLIAITLMLMCSTAYAGYVQGHNRSNPNSAKPDNYGRPSSSDRAYGVPASQRDYDDILDDGGDVLDDSGDVLDSGGDVLDDNK